jgi:hypothetical protein
MLTIEGKSDFQLNCDSIGMKTQDSDATTVLSSYRAPAPRKVSKIVRNNSKDWFGTSQEPVFTTTIGLIQSCESDSSLSNSEVDSGDRILGSLPRLDEDFHELSYPSQGNAEVDLESFYPVVLNFESGKIVAANGDIHTVMRTTTCELGIALSSVSVGKSKEPTVSVIRNCLSIKPEARHPGRRHDSRKAFDAEDTTRCAINTESSMHSYDTVVTGDADSSGPSGLVLDTRTPPSRSTPPLEAVGLNSAEIGRYLSQRIDRHEQDTSPLQDISGSTDPAQESPGVPAIKENEEFFQCCSPPSGLTFMDLSSKEMEESNLKSEAGGITGSVQEKRHQKQLKGNKVNQQQRKNHFSPSEKLDGVRGTIRSVYSTGESSGHSCVGLTKTRSGRSEGDEEGGGGEEMKDSYDLNNHTCDSMHVTSTACQSIPDPPFQVTSLTPGCCQDLFLSAPSMDRTATEIGLNKGIEKSNGLHVAPLTPTPRTGTNSPSNIRVTIRTLLTALARQKLSTSTSPEAATGPVGNKQTFSPKVAAPSFLSSSFSSSFSPLITTSMELIKQGVKALFFLFLAVTVLISVCIVFGQNKAFPSYPSQASASPWVGQFNASDVISDRCVTPYYLFVILN